MSENPQDNENPQGSEPTTPSVKTGAQDTPEPTFTQADLDRIVKERLSRERQTYESKLKERYSVDDLSEVDKLLDEQRKRKEAELSEAEKVQAELVKVQEQLKAQQETNTTLLQQMRDDKRDGDLRSKLDNAHNIDTALRELKAHSGDKLDSLWSEDNVFNGKAAEQVIAVFQQENGYLFKSSNPGSPSNSGGRPPQPDQKNLQAARSAAFSRKRRAI